MYIDLSDKIIGDWKVINKDQSVNNRCMWKCQCVKCGSIKSCSSYNLKRGLPVCDCSISRRRQHFNAECKNKFVRVDKNTFEMYDLDGNCTLVDSEDLIKIKKYYWRKQKSGYWSSMGNLNLHRYIMDCQDKMIVDHINHNKDDHRKCALRVCTAQQNQFNKKPKPRNCNLPTGVYETPYHKFRASIRTKFIKLHKNFDTIEEAIKQRKEWEKVYIGEYQYNIEGCYK